MLLDESIWGKSYLKYHKTGLLVPDRLLGPVTSEEDD